MATALTTANFKKRITGGDVTDATLALARKDGIPLSTIKQWVQVTQPKGKHMDGHKKKRKPSAYNIFVRDYLNANPGTGLDVVAAAWRSGGSMAKSKAAKSCVSTIVPTSDGAGVTTRGGQYLRASFEGHTEVKFDQGALGAVWAGIVERLRQSGGSNLAALFPDLYPDAAMAMRANRQHADERAIGNQMAPSLGAVLVAYGVTPEEWASWYALAAQERFVVPAQRGMCVTVGAAINGNAFPGLPAEAGIQANQFGGVLGAPSGATLPGNFGQVR